MYKKKLATKLVLYILVCSTVITLVLTVIQLYRDYKLDIGNIHSRLDHIGISSVPSLSEDLWVVNTSAIALNLEGLKALPDLQYLAVVSVEGEVVARQGQVQHEHIIKRNFDLVYKHRGEILPLGQLHVIASLHGVYQRLLDKALVILVSQGTKTFIVSTFIFFICQWLVTQHLITIAGHASRLHSDGIETPLKLNRPLTNPADNDELDQVVTSFNEMQENLSALYRQLVEHRDELNQKVKDRTKELDEINQELQSYSYSIAHDLRTPLRSIVSFSQILKSDLGEQISPECADSLERIINASKHMAVLIDDILELSKISQKDMITTTVDMSKEARTISGRLTLLSPQRKIEWRIHDGIHCKGDQQLVHVMLDNLLNNAWKYTQYTELTEIEFGVDYNEGRKIYYIHDNGIGFDMRFQKSLFKPFNRLHDRTKFEGTGIGLATVKRVVERHKGEVWIESKMNVGTTVFFTLLTG